MSLVEVEVRQHLWVREDGMVLNRNKARLGRKPKQDWHCGTRNAYGYLHVTIPGLDKEVMVHRLVAEAFIPNPDNKPEVDHINGNRGDNRAENLRWATRRENVSNSAIHRSGRLVGASPRNGRWRASATVGGKQKHIGNFDTEFEAHQAYLSFISEEGKGA